MSRLSVPDAAARLGVSPARVRQRIADGSLVAERIGGRWLVDLSVSGNSPLRGRPAESHVVWDAIRRANPDGPSPDLVLADGSPLEIGASISSRRRSDHRLAALARAVQSADDSREAVALLSGWLAHRADRRLYRVADPDFQPLAEDPRLVRSGVSDARSGMADPRVVEAYVAVGDVAEMVEDHWLEPIGVDQVPNVILHVAPGRPSEVSVLMLAADLAEHGGPREVRRAQELLAEVLA